MLNNARLYTVFLTFLFLSPVRAIEQGSDNNAQKPVIVLDIHGVLATINYWRMTKTICWGLCKEPSLITQLRPSTFKDAACLAHPTLKAIYTCYDSNQEMWQLVRDLKKAGYAIYIFSNIYDTAFVELCKELLDHFELFDGHHIVCNNNRALQKPAATAYASCKALIAQKHPNRTIIFADDSSKNIEAAQKAGFIGILFSSAQQLKRELARYNVTV